MAEPLGQQKERIGVNNREAKQQQASLEHLKQQRSNQSTKQLSQENQSNSIAQDNAIKETLDKPEIEEGDKKVNITKMTAAMGAGSAITEITAPTSAVSGVIPSTAVTATHAAPLVTGLTAVFGFF